MAPNRIVVSNNGRPQKGFMSTVYDEATSPENTTIVRSLLIFGVRLSNSSELMILKLTYSRLASRSSTAASASSSSLRKSRRIPIQSLFL
jgi:hypothetical protein